MKKRLLITSIVMMLVVAVALSTATYAWFTSNANVSATAVVLTASTADGDAIMISHAANNTGLGSTVALTTFGAGRLYPATPLAVDSFTTELNSDKATEALILADVAAALPNQFQNLIMKGAGTYIDPDIDTPNISYYTDTVYVYNKGTVAKNLVPTITIYHTTATTSLLAAKSVRIALIERKGTEVASGDVTFGNFTLRGIYEFDDSATVNVYDAVEANAEFDGETTYYTHNAQNDTYTADASVDEENFETKVAAGLYVIGTNRKTVAKNGANGSNVEASGYGVEGVGPYTRGDVLFTPDTTFATINVPTSGHYVANAYTVVMWLEGWDDDCTNSITEGAFSVGIDFAVGA